VDFLKAQGPAARVNGNKIVLQGEMKTEGDRIKGAFNIARDLAEVVKAGKKA
jgi:transcription-repair coupling factor (superfamily II helicase)